MKKALILLACLSILLVSCEKEPKESKTYSISPDNGTWIEENGVITFSPESEKTEYIISGTYEGQLKNTVKGTVFKLDGFEITNENGPAIYGELKTEVSATENSENSITGAGDAAFLCEKGVEIGGSGKLNFKGTGKHGIKGSSVEVKGSGTFTVEGTADGSAINCNEFQVKEDKAFTLNLLNSKNGIKADNTIEIASGSFNFTDCKTCLKTDTSEDDPENDHYIKLSGGTFTASGQKNFYSTEDKGYDDTGAIINQ